MNFAELAKAMASGFISHTTLKGIVPRANGGTGTDSPLPVYANNAAALAGGLAVGAFYRTGADPDPVCVVH
jgi:hypothetical protein